MTESQIALTEGSGKNLHTWQRTIGGTAREDDFYIEGAPTFTTYTAIAPACSVGSASGHLLQVMGDGTHYVRLERLEFRQVGTAGVDSLATYQLRLVTTAGSGGTAINARPHDESDTDPYAGDVRYVPTTKGTEGSLLWQTRMPLADALPDYRPVVWDRPAGNVKQYIAGPGTADGFVLVNSTGIGTATVDIIATFTVSEYL